ncbi:hypothetical protein GJ744_000371 [Endocarpon pusillum]|uniref:SNF2 N-terminal domain-containing protein n=1 Tax=Endocarpon pusillum TaxID=364733 RepID=A0A8H7AR43_9EURO|nr:hypothetical protein GJ744_000371 [Endocarpon pusillum]
MSFLVGSAFLPQSYSRALGAATVQSAYWAKSKSGIRFSILTPRKVPDRFWELQRNIATVTRPTPDYEDACEQLELDPQLLQIPGDDPTGPLMRLKPWQVTGAALMEQMETSPLKGGVVADNCGLGKTILTSSTYTTGTEAICNAWRPATIYVREKLTLIQFYGRDKMNFVRYADGKRILSLTGKTILTLFHIYNRYRGDLQLLAAGEIVQFKPTLIVCPAGLVDVWFDEWSSHFRDKLNPIQFHGQEKMYPAERCGYVASSKVEDLVAQLTQGYSPSNPESGRLIVLSSLSSWEGQTWKTMKASDYYRAKRSQKKGKAKVDTIEGRHRLSPGLA